MNCCKKYSFFQGFNNQRGRRSFVELDQLGLQNEVFTIREANSLLASLKIPHKSQDSNINVVFRFLCVGRHQWLCSMASRSSKYAAFA